MQNPEITARYQRNPMEDDKADNKRAAAAIFTVFAVVFGFVFWSGLCQPHWFAPMMKAGEVAGKVVTAIAVFFALFVASRRAEIADSVAKTAADGQLTNRFNQAVEHLGQGDKSDENKLAIRLGGIYALERIAKDSKRDHWTVMEVLCSYARNHSDTTSAEHAALENFAKLAEIRREDMVIEDRYEEELFKDQLEDERKKTRLEATMVLADVQAILTVVGRRKTDAETEGERLDLIGVNLHRANLNKADLREAILRGADLRGADLRGVDLRDADLGGARFFKADLRGADLRGAKNLRPNQLVKARGNSKSELSAEDKRPESWDKDPVKAG
jgi:hypothetical protein